jgi:hypothetical protein
LRAALTEQAFDSGGIFSEMGGILFKLRNSPTSLPLSMRGLAIASRFDGGAARLTGVAE